LDVAILENIIKDLKNIQLNLKQKLNINGRNFRGGSLLPDGRMVLSCYRSNTISFINKEGVELFQIGKDKIGSETYDTVYIKDDNSIAVSSGDKGGNKCITIKDIESQEIITTISMDTYIYGMAVRGRTIYYCTGNTGLKMLNINDKSVSQIINSNMSNIFCMTTSGDKLYYTNCHTDTVTCCDLHGTTQWEFKDERVLENPHGISVDNNGNVYVVGCSSNNVEIISPYGQRHRQALSSGDGLVQPRALNYDKAANRVLVVNESESAFLFDVTVGQ
jgi:DNA-binding beta-propeller fold protein YncE